jgi:CheY-like chemotaxis protein
MKTLLLVEDSEDDVFLMKRSFTRADIHFDLQVVQDGDQAVEYLSGKGIFADRATYPLPTLVLLDVKLPRRNGQEVLSWIRSQPQLKGLPVVMLTSSSEPEDVDRAYRNGANSYLVKPINYEQLDKMLPLLMEYWLSANVSPYIYT